MEITFEKAAGLEILKMLGLENSPKCHYCNVVITEENLGGVFCKPMRICCTNLLCLMNTISIDKMTKRNTKSWE